MYVLLAITLGYTADGIASNRLIPIHNTYYYS